MVRMVPHAKKPPSANLNCLGTLGMVPVDLVERLELAHVLNWHWKTCKRRKAQNKHIYVYTAFLKQIHSIYYIYIYILYICNYLHWHLYIHIVLVYNNIQYIIITIIIINIYIYICILVDTVWHVFFPSGHQHHWNGQGLATWPFSKDAKRALYPDGLRMIDRYEWWIWTDLGAINQKQRVCSGRDGPQIQCLWDVERPPWMT